MYSITKNGRPLDKSLYTIDEDKKIFVTEESGLVLDFNSEYGWTFKTTSNCTFDTDSDCVVVRRDVYEVIELDGTKKIKLNDWDTKGYTIIGDEPVKSLSGKTVKVELDGVCYEAVIK